MSDVLAALLIGGLGYKLGRAPFEAWENFINRYNERLGHLTYNQIVEPIAFYGKVDNGKIIYAEAVFAYLVGLPNASLPMTFRCLEIGLKQKHKEVEGQEPSLTAYELIEWSETYLGNRAELAHGFRRLRNLLHEESIIKEQDALEAIRHVTNILNLIFPFSAINLTGVCAFCGKPYSLPILSDQCYLGNTIPVRCDQCSRSTNHFVIPL